MRPSRAMVLAAGLGTRMRPLTDLVPKPALPALGRPIIGWVLDHLASHGVRFVVVNTHHLPGTMEKVVRESAPAGMEVAFSHEGTILGTAGGLRKAARHFDQETFYLVNSDSLTDADLTAAALAHAGSGRQATLVVIPHDPASGYRPVGVVEGDPAGRVASIAGKRWGREDLALRTFTGIHLLEPEVLEAIPPGVACDINADVYPWLLDERAGSVGAWTTQAWWYEAGTPSRYLDLNLEMMRRRGVSGCAGAGCWTDPAAIVRACSVGDRVRIGPRARVEESVLWDDVTVGEGVTLSRCVVTSGVDVPLMSLEGVLVTRSAKGDLAMEKL